jgi:regulator of sirC expression with transglutaminase-like and TPR domain
VTPSLGESRARTRFAELIARPSVPLAEAALAIAEEEYPGLSVESCLGQLDALARAVEGRLPARRDAASTLRLLRAVLFEEAGFRGNADAYYDPRNSFLNEVLERRLGIPITLSILYIEVAARVGLAVQGVGFPGHFLVKHVAGQREVFIDPFHGGEILSADDCVARFHTMAPGRALEPRHLEAVTTRQILGRVLHNLKRIYVEAGDDVRALWVMDRLVLLAPADPAERRDRGLVEARLGGVAAALADLDAYLAAAPSADDADEVRDLVQQLRGTGKGLLN